MSDVMIGITDCAKYENYANWIKELPGVEVIKLSYDDPDFSAIDDCDGILLSGGQDVHPQFYDKLEYMDFYKGTVPDIDEQRDVFEWKVLAYSQENKLPVLGICRGLQLANAFFGGTLLLDIPSAGKNNHSKFREGEDRIHLIEISAGSTLEKIAGINTGIVNSAHHQSAAEVAENLTINAVSEDGVIEALERKDFEAHPYLLLVQWHPERMTDQQSPLSANIRRSFIEAIRTLKMNN